MISQARERSNLSLALARNSSFSFSYLTRSSTPPPQGWAVGAAAARLLCEEPVRLAPAAEMRGTGHEFKASRATVPFLVDGGGFAVTDADTGCFGTFAR